MRVVVAALGTCFSTVDADSAQHIFLACGREKRGPYRGLAHPCNSYRVLRRAPGVNRLWYRFRWSRPAAPRPCLPTSAGPAAPRPCLPTDAGPAAPRPCLPTSAGPAAHRPCLPTIAGPVAPRPCLPTVAGLHGGSWCLFPHSCHLELGYMCLTVSVFSFSTSLWCPRGYLPKER